jgi:electron transfer flavoprotein alpha subunit
LATVWITSLREAIAYGCDEVHVIDDPSQELCSALYGKPSDLCREVKPEIVLIGATPTGRDLSGIVATLIETGLTADFTGLDIDCESGCFDDTADVRREYNGHHLL